MEERCLLCGEPIPEGRQVCTLCEEKVIRTCNCKGDASRHIVKLKGGLRKWIRLYDNQTRKGEGTGE